MTSHPYTWKVYSWRNSCKRAFKNQYNLVAAWVFFCSALVLDRASLCNPGCCGTRYVSTHGLQTHKKLPVCLLNASIKDRFTTQDHVLLMKAGQLFQRGWTSKYCLFYALRINYCWFETLQLIIIYILRKHQYSSQIESKVKHRQFYFQIAGYIVSDSLWGLNFLLTGVLNVKGREWPPPAENTQLNPNSIYLIFKIYLFWELERWLSG